MYSLIDHEARPLHLRLALDACAASKLVEVYKDQLPDVTRRLNREFRLVTCPQTLAELMLGVINGTSEHFETAKRKVLLMLGTKSVNILSNPAAFAIDRVLDIPPSNDEKDMTKAMQMRVKILLASLSQEHLLQGGVRLRDRSRRKRAKLNPSELKYEMETGIRDHNAVMQAVREGRAQLPSREQYAASYAKHLGQTLSEEQTKMLSVALDAIWHHKRWLYNNIFKGHYNYRIRTGDWVDGSQLFYLADPGLRLLTDDKKLKERITGSCQENQIILLRHFLKERGFQVLH